jgi:pimeloyl-ACP methyl ester carboxylesterase
MMIGSSPEPDAAMDIPPDVQGSALAAKLAAPQHRPRPLPLFLSMLRSETGGDAARMGRALDGLRRYQEAPREAGPEAPAAVAEAMGATLRDYGAHGPLHHPAGGHAQVQTAPRSPQPVRGTGVPEHPPASWGRTKTPAVFVPSLINPPSILDLAQGNSLLRWLAAQGGVRPLLVDWGWDVAARRDLSVAGHVTEILLPLLETLGEPAVLVGYCLGGTMALGAAARAPDKVRGVATIAAPWRFAGFPDEARAMLAQLWAATQPTAERLGMLPMEALQSAFWSLDPARTVAKFEAFAGMEAGRRLGQRRPAPPLCGGEGIVRNLLPGRRDRRRPLAPPRPERPPLPRPGNRLDHRPHRPRRDRGRRRRTDRDGARACRDGGGGLGAGGAVGAAGGVAWGAWGLGPATYRPERQTEEGINGTITSITPIKSSILPFDNIAAPRLTREIDADQSTVHHFELRKVHRGK